MSTQDEGKDKKLDLQHELLAARLELSVTRQLQPLHEGVQLLQAQHVTLGDRMGRLEARVDEIDADVGGLQVTAGIAEEVARVVSEKHAAAARPHARKAGIWWGTGAAALLTAAWQVLEGLGVARWVRGLVGS